ncbi:cell wall protein IFF6-like isoform X1 [Ischnura elegans]|uniref:cell wall protein IFF6-like isoform X1 n=1 Tax=Ischnura elegans TaxID=197161 RepID=UPI001ED89675|nr:cell wall protein IFF6-like isoform X1 [Ischnura elegans]
MGSLRSRAPLLLALACFVAAALSSPVPHEGGAPDAVRDTVETLAWDTPSHDRGERDKRTIGFLRTLFPGISEIIDRKIQSLTRVIFQLVGRLVLGGGGGSRASSSTTGDDGSRRISITLPTFPPDLEDEAEDEQQQTDTPADTTSPSDEENFAGSESRVNEVRVPFESSRYETEEEEDQAAAATGDDEQSENAAAEDSAAAASDDNADRDKRFLFFGGNGDGSGGSGGSAGGSGNFLFDIIRLITGSGSAEGGSSDSSSSSGGDGGAYAGFTASVGADGGAAGAAAGAGASAPSPSDPNDGYTSGIPGPLTRLFIIANRGISNLLQDLILRLSQTSERIVNFKARLITALI